MKRFLSIILTLILILNFSLISGSVCFGMTASAEESVDYIPEPVDLTSREDFSLGVNVHAKSYAAYPEAYLEEQIHAVARMGSKWIRMNGTIPEDGDWSYLDTAVGLCNKYGLKIIMVIYPSLNVSLDYITLFCETFAYRYNGEDGRGYVDVFQVLNEVDITLLRAKYGGSSPGGESETQYYTIPVDGAADLPEYLEYFQAAEKGIHSKDSNSKFMINFSARHCGMISYFLRNGLKLDFVGWDLYTNKPHNRVESVQEMQSAYDLVEESIYKKYNVPVILCETNVNVGMLSKEERKNAELSSYETLVDNLYLAFNRPWIKAAILYELLDEPSFGSDSAESSFGLIKNLSGGSGVLDVENEKPIYRQLQKLVGGNRSLPVVKKSEIDLKPYEKLVVGTADDSDIGNNGTSSEDIGSDNESSNENTSSNAENNVSKEPEKIIEEVIVENIITPVKDIKSTETSYRMPWILIIVISVALLFVAGGVITVFLIVSKKKLKK